MTQITIRGEVDDRAVQQLERCALAGEAPLAAMLPDGHVGYSQPIGGAVGYRDYISPSGVGYDIGCGNKAVATNLLYGEIRADLPRIMDEIFRRVSFGVGRANDEPLDHPVFDEINTRTPQIHKSIHGLLPKARKQLGTVGSGNHYVDLFREERTDRVWIGVHFGSRGFGHAIASGFLALAQGLSFDDRAKEGEMDAPPTLLHVDSQLGYMYIEAMKLAGEFAYAGRDVVCDKVLEILGASETRSVHNHHNFAWREEHWVDGAREELWVVRKGCTPAFPGQEGFVGATMGEPSVILEGSAAATADMRALMFSTVHGAGRVMSRTQAAGKMGTVAICSDRDCDYQIPWREFAQDRDRGVDRSCPQHLGNKMLKRRVRVKGGLIDYDEVRDELRRKNIVIRGGGADEAPDAYKRLDSVLGYVSDTIDIKHKLWPIGVAMAGSDTYDPWKD